MIEERALTLAAALESGQYQQTSNYLDTGTAQCCLGVACKIMPGLTITRPNPEDAVFYNGCYQFLPLAAMEYYGFFNDSGQRRDRHPLIFDDQSYRSLSVANDHGVTFPKIAAYIRAHWQHL